MTTNRRLMAASAAGGPPIASCAPAAATYATANTTARRQGTHSSSSLNSDCSGARQDRDGSDVCRRPRTMAARVRQQQQPRKLPSANHQRTTKSPSGQATSTLLLLALLQLHIHTAPLWAATASKQLVASPAGQSGPQTRHGWSSLATNRQQEPPATFPTSRLGRIHSQLAHLRRQLADELQAPAEPQVALLGAPCLQSSHCSHLPGARCNLDNFTCTCASQHIQFNSTTCLAPTLLGFQCLVDGQCQRKVPGSLCLRGQCSCREEYVPHRKDKCLAASKLDDYCLADGQCQLNDRHSYCKWRIPHVYGHCKCPPNYKIMAADANATTSLKCVPRLGDTCLSDSECLLGTVNSLCRAAGDDHQLRTSWPSSRASQLRCQCRAGFLASSNRLNCVATTQDEVGEGRQVALGPRDHYELVPSWNQQVANRSSFAQPTQESQEFELAAPVTPPAATTSVPSTTTTTTTSTTTSTTKPVPVAPVSLGQRCSSDAECRAADPNSQCLEGRCECTAPTPSCSSNSTGCHPNTFQCRRSGQCISWYFVCDQFKNCDDGSDEEACGPLAAEPERHCPPEAFQCESGSHCLSRAKLCNGLSECPDGSDERHCATAAPPNATRPACHPRAFACRSGLCLPAHVFCNAAVDCPDGSDEEERLCDPPAWQARRKWPEATTTPPPDSPVVKWERRRIEQQMAALRLASPRQGRSLSPWSSPSSSPPPPRPQQPVAEACQVCPAGTFACANGRCRSTAILCSGVNGCGDNSDENRCQVCRCAAPNSTGEGFVTEPNRSTRISSTNLDQHQIKLVQ